MLKIKDNVDLKELEKFGFEKIDGFPIQYKRKYKDLELDTDMFILVDSRDDSFYVTKDTYLLYDFKEATDNKYIDDLIKADLVEKVDDK